MIKHSSIAAALLLAVVSAGATAQGSTDAGGVGGAGAAVTSALAPIGLPGNVSASGAQLRASLATTTTARANFANAVGAISISSPAGGTVSLPAEQARSLGSVLSGRPSAEASAAATAEFGGGAAGAALVTALTNMGGSPVNTNVNAAIGAYNAAVNALPAGQTPSPMLLAARQTLVQITAARAAAAR